MATLPVIPGVADFGSAILAAGQDAGTALHPQQNAGVQGDPVVCRPRRVLKNGRTSPRIATALQRIPPSR